MIGQPAMVVLGLVFAAIISFVAYRTFPGFFPGKSSSPSAGQGAIVKPIFSTQEENPSNGVVEIKATVFSPKVINIRVGQAVTWKNKDGSSHQIVSDVHPTHLLYPPLNTVGTLKPGDKKSLIFPAPGTYDYHDHLNPSITGRIRVK